MKNKYIVFDLDGTLADTQIIHQRIESEFLNNFGVLIKPEDIGKKYAGRSPQEWIPELLNQNNIVFTQNDIEKFVDGKDEKVISLLKNGDIKLMEGTKNILNNLYSRGYKLGISSGACREFIDNFIDYFDFNKIIESSTSANEVINKKPHPDVFEKSFDQLEEKYGDSIQKIVIGDGWSDVMGGKGCGAITIWINNNNPLDSKILDFQVSTINDIYEIIIKQK